MNQRPRNDAFSIWERLISEERHEGNRQAEDVGGLSV